MVFLGENQEKRSGFGLHQLRNRYTAPIRKNLTQIYPHVTIASQRIQSQCSLKSARMVPQAGKVHATVMET